MVDQEHVRTLGAWIGASLAIAVGAAVALACRSEHAAMLVVVAIVLAVACVAIGVANTDRTATAWLVAALWLALFARGLDDGHRDRDRWREGHRGAATGMRDLEVVGASVPGARCRVRVRMVGQDEVGWVALAPERCPLAHGDRLRVRAAALRHASGPIRPGATAPDDSALAAGADAALHVGEVWLGPHAPATGTTMLARWMARQRERAWADSRGDEARAFVAAAVLGVRTALPQARRTELRAAGLGHLVAVSGLHVGLAAWLAFAVLVRALAGIGGGLTPGVVVALVLLILYVAVTGGAASAVRAGIMVGIVAVGMLRGRPHHGLVTLAIACASMLAVRPSWLFDPGFQLSAAAMAGVVSGGRGTSMLAMTWRVTWAIAPVSLVHFGTVSVWGLLGNLVAIPILSLWVLPLGLLGWASVATFGAVAWDPAAIGGAVVLDVAAGLARLPPVSIDVVVVVAAIAVIGAPLGRRLARRGLVLWPPTLFAIATLVAAVAVAWPSPDPRLRWLALGDARTFMLVTIDADGIACVERPSADPEPTLRMLEAIGVRGIASIAPPDDPAALALARAAAAAGWVVHDGSCVQPDIADVRQVLRACAPAPHDRFSHRVAGEDLDGRATCFTAGTWREP